MQDGARQLEHKDGTLGRGKKKDGTCWIWQAGEQEDGDPSL